MEKLANLIGGQLRAPSQGSYLENFDPSRGRAYSLVPDSNEGDVGSAIDSAQKAFGPWSRKTLAERAGLVRRLGELILLNKERLSLAETRDNGKPISLSMSLDIPRSAQNFLFFADLIQGFHGESFMTDDRALNYTTYNPLGVVGCISPWNLPLYLLTWKLAPALVAGNTVVAKPSEVTPMTAYLLSQLSIEAGLPPGVLNIVHGLGPKVGAPLASHPAVKALSFTGSTQTGRVLASTLAPSFKKISLEMGGKNASVVFADCDWERALAGVQKSAFLNQGQICLCGSRIFVEKKIYKKFVDELVESVRKIKIGDPMDTSSDFGALVSEPHLEKVLGYIGSAKKQGGVVLTGGERLDLGEELSGGYFISPTLIENLSQDSSLNQEEIFGPVATVQAFDSEDEVIGYVNSTKYGLAGSVWTQDIDRGHRVAQAFHSGLVWVNTWMLRDLRTPFGGVKESGFGREGGMEALRFFSEVKTICVGLKL